MLATQIQIKNKYFGSWRISLCHLFTSSAVKKKMQYRTVMKHGKISSSEQNRSCNIQPSELESRNETNKTLFHAWNKRPKEGTKQGKLIFPMPI